MGAQQGGFRQALAGADQVLQHPALELLHLGQRTGQWFRVAEQLGRALNRLEAMRPEIGKEYLDRYESDLQDMRRRIADFEAKAERNGRP